MTPPPTSFWRRIFARTPDTDGAPRTEPPSWEAGTVVYSGPWDGWCPAPSGLMVRFGEEIRLLRGAATSWEAGKTVYSGPWDVWRPAPSGLMVRRGEEIRLLRGAATSWEAGKTFYSGPLSNWCPAPSGLMVSRGGEIRLFRVAPPPKPVTPPPGAEIIW